MYKKLGLSLLLVGGAVLLVSCGPAKNSASYSHDSSHDSYCQIAWPTDIWEVDPAVDEYISKNDGVKTVSYTLTKDTEIVLRKNYYKKNADNSYQRVIAPVKADLGTYYEIGDTSGFETFFHALQKNDWVPNKVSFEYEEIVDYGTPNQVDWYESDSRRDINLKYESSFKRYLNGPTIAGDIKSTVSKMVDQNHDNNPKKVSGSKEGKSETTLTGVCEFKDKIAVAYEFTDSKYNYVIKKPYTYQNAKNYLSFFQTSDAYAQSVAAYTDLDLKDYVDVSAVSTYDPFTYPAAKALTFTFDKDTLTADITFEAYLYEEVENKATGLVDKYLSTRAANLHVEDGYVADYSFSTVKSLFVGGGFRVLEGNYSDYVLSYSEDQTFYQPTIIYTDFPEKDFEDYDI